MKFKIGDVVRTTTYKLKHGHPGPTHERYFEGVVAHNFIYQTCPETPILKIGDGRMWYVLASELELVERDEDVYY